ncbi:hypothetical protein HELRODRAFT_189209 [Helobdella robusta]|uniref:Coiled-coil domain-containing protein 22 homolog n=1 Tax=Helobdella robusta TaxID=6412 RepID=T1FQS7_HELRO|nr:hypothetical protein HELRODRAFT_189209 [Helobdella robusta]ESN96352.1 hypothetical protein HELRODRAFT_189209 [Helobdella robusta]
MKWECQEKKGSEQWTGRTIIIQGSQMDRAILRPPDLDGISGVGQLSAENVVDAVGRCIRLIDPSVDVKCKLPSNMAAKYRVGTQLADAVKGLNYQGEVGYHTFLYVNEVEMRKIFSFLISRLPKDRSIIEQECLTPQVLLRRSINQTINHLLKQAWLPPYCCIKEEKVKRPFNAHVMLVPNQFDRQNNIPQELQKYYSHHLPLSTQQFANKSTTSTNNSNNKTSILFCSILQYNSLKVAQERRERYNNNIISSSSGSDNLKDSILSKKSKENILSKISSQIKESLKHTNIASSSAQLTSSSLLSSSSSSSSSKFRAKQKMLATSPSSSSSSSSQSHVLSNVEADKQLTDTKPILEVAVPVGKDEDEELRDLEDKLKKFVGELNEKGEMMESLKEHLHQMKGQISDLTNENKRRKAEAKMKKKMIGLLPEAQESIVQLENVVSEAEQRLAAMMNQWEDRKKQLEEELIGLQIRSDNNETRRDHLLDELNEVRCNLKLASGQAQEKNLLHKQLLIELEKMTTHGPSRSTYTTRILEIVANIMKQNQEIEKILVDTRSVQKEINQVSGVLERTFIVTDELLFKNAKSDETSRRAYKLLASLHENCSSLVKSVEEIGEITKETRDIEEQLEIERDNQTEESLERISNDFKLIKLENQQLIQQLKSKMTT